MGFKSWLTGKKEAKKHPLFPELPNGVGLHKLIEFKPSCQTYFLLNESKTAVKVPDLGKSVVSAVSSFSLFDIEIKRAYLDSKDPEVILQFNCIEKEMQDCILFNKTSEIVLDTRQSIEEWNHIIGDKDISTPKGFTYTREWMADLSEYGDKVSPLYFNEQFFTKHEDYTPIQNKAMLYARILEGGNPEDIEYLLASIRTGIRRERVEIWVGTVINIGQIDII